MSEPKNFVYQKIGASSGIVAPFVAFACILIAIATYPSFNWTTNALSDLGIVPGATSELFNFGLLATGLLAFNFAVFGLYTYFNKSWVGKIGSVAFAASSLALIAISVFNENFSPTHYIVSVLFFATAPIAMFILTCAFYISHQHKMAAFTVAIGVAAALPWILQFTLNYVPNVAIPELISGIAVSIWVIAVGKKMLKP